MDEIFQIIKEDVPAYWIPPFIWTSLLVQFVDLFVGTYLLELYPDFTFMEPFLLLSFLNKPLITIAILFRMLYSFILYHWT